MTSRIIASVQLCAPEEAGRRPLEGLMRAVYRRAYGARLGNMMPLLLGARVDGRLVGALGLRPGPLPMFLDNYLSTSATDLLPASAPDTVVEVGNLAGIGPGSSRLLVRLLTAVLHGASREWAVFTATRPLRNVFQRLGVPMLMLAPAAANRLGGAARQWGTYYDEDPWVSAVAVADAAAVLRGDDITWLSAVAAGRANWDHMVTAANAAAVEMADANVVA